MASITVRGLDDKLKKKLRIRAAENGRSMEQEVRIILHDTIECDVSPNSSSLFDQIRADVARLGGVELELLPREPIGDPPEFD